MSDSDYQIEHIGEIYARALLNLARQGGEATLAQITDDVRSIGELLKSNPGFAQLMGAVTLSPEQHYAALEKIFSGRVHQLTLETLKSLARRGRLMFIGGLVEGYESLIRKSSGHIEVEVITASALSGETVARVRDAVGRATGQQPDVTVTENPAIIGGIQVRVGDTLIDASVESQLERMRQQMKRGGLDALQKRAAVTA